MVLDLFSLLLGKSSSGGGGGGGGSDGTIFSGTGAPTADIGRDGSLYLQYGRESFSDWGVYRESSMSVQVAAHTIVFDYLGGSTIGAQAYKQFDLTNIDSLIFTMTSGHYTYNNYQTERFSPLLIIENTLNPSNNFVANTIAYVPGSRISTNDTTLTFKVDVSSYVGNYWIVFCSYGCDATVTSLALSPALTDDISQTYLKVNGAWQALTGSGIDDVSETTALLLDKTITENGTYYPSDDGVDAYGEITVDVEGGGGEGTTNMLSGTDAPTSDIGEDGAVYLRYGPAGVKNSAGQYINTGYNGVTSSRYVIQFMLAKPQSAYWPTPFGARSGNIQDASLVSLASSQQVYNGVDFQWGTTNSITSSMPSVNDLLYKPVQIELENGIGKIIVDGVTHTHTFTQSSVSNTTPMFIFACGIGGAYQNWSPVDGMILYSFEIYENNTLIHRFVPAKDTNDIVCVLDEVSGEYKYVNSGTLEYVDANSVIATYLKVNGAWQALTGSDIDDVNRGGMEATVFTGKTTPSAATGTNGDIYLEYESLPTGVTRVEYIESTGTQYISTGVAANTSNVTVSSRIMITAAHDATQAGGDAIWAASWNYGGYLLIRYGASPGVLRWHGRTGVDAAIQLNEWLDVSTTPTGMIVSDVQYPMAYYVNYSDPICLFGATNIGTGTLGIFRLKRTKIYSNDSLIRDFVPVIDSNDEACLYDLVTQDYYRNAGTGSFVAGPVVTVDDPITNTYLKVDGVWQNLIGSDVDDVKASGSDDPFLLTEYIESSGTQYIDTGYYPNDNTTIEAVAAVQRGTTIYPTIFGMRPQSYSPSGSHDIVLHFYDNNTRLTNFMWDTQIGSSNYSRYLGQKAVYHLGKGGYGVKSENFAVIDDTTTLPGSITGTYTLYLFTMNLMGTAYADSFCVMSLYRFRIWESGVLVHEYLPKQHNGVACLYDTVTKTYLYNAGTGDFVYGSDV